MKSKNLTENQNAGATNTKAETISAPGIATFAPGETHKTTMPALSRLPRRKIDHLPQKTRDSINIMIRNGVPLREITRRFRASGEQINKDNLLRWKKTGFLKWQKEEKRREDSHDKIRFLLSLVQDKKNTRILQAGRQIAVLQVADILSSLDPQSLRESFQGDPGHYVRLLNTVPRLTEDRLAWDRQRAELAKARESKPAELGVLTQETLEQIEEQLRLL